MVANYRSQEVNENCGMCDQWATANCRRCVLPICDAHFEKEKLLCSGCSDEWGELLKSIKEPLSEYEENWFEVAAHVLSAFAGLTTFVVFMAGEFWVAATLGLLSGSFYGVGVAARKSQKWLVSRKAKKRFKKFANNAPSRLLAPGQRLALLPIGAAIIAVSTL